MNTIINKIIKSQSMADSVIKLSSFTTRMSSVSSKYTYSGYASDFYDTQEYVTISGPMLCETITVYGRDYTSDICNNIDGTCSGYISHEYQSDAKYTDCDNKVIVIADGNTKYSSDHVFVNGKFTINKIIKNITIAEDLAQDAFVEVYVHKERFVPGKASFKTYLYYWAESKIVYKPLF